MNSPDIILFEQRNGCSVFPCARKHVAMSDSYGPKTDAFILYFGKAVKWSAAAHTMAFSGAAASSFSTPFYQIQHPALMHKTKIVWEFLNRTFSASAGRQIKIARTHQILDST
jgi:hypothetical protein